MALGTLSRKYMPGEEDLLSSLASSVAGDWSKLAVEVLPTISGDESDEFVDGKGNAPVESPDTWQDGHCLKLKLVMKRSELPLDVDAYEGAVTEQTTHCL